MTKEFKNIQSKDHKVIEKRDKTIIFYAVHMLRRTNLKTTLLSFKNYKFDSFLFRNSKSTV